MTEKKDLGRPFNDKNLDSIAKKILNLRHAYIAHNDLSKMRNMTSFLQENKLFGSDIIIMIDALKKRLIQYDEKLGSKIDVNKLFRLTTTNAGTDIESWLKSFKNEL